VRGLRPPALDELGLAAALRTYADKLAPLRVDFDLEWDLSTLSAAVEIAVYRIASEALANVVRHASAQSCQVSLHRRDGLLVLRIEDDGSGLPFAVEAGVGLRSMRERAAELGGRFTLGHSPGAGVLVEVCLPETGRQP
jgi:signal transduction histidine kinase